MLIAAELPVLKVELKLLFREPVRQCRPLVLKCDPRLDICRNLAHRLLDVKNVGFLCQLLVNVLLVSLGGQDVLHFFYAVTVGFQHMHDTFEGQFDYFRNVRPLCRHLLG